MILCGTDNLSVNIDGKKLGNSLPLCVGNLVVIHPFHRVFHVGHVIPRMLFNLLAVSPQSEIVVLGKRTLTEQDLPCGYVLE